MSSHHPPTFLGTTHTPPYVPSHSQSISRTSSNAGRSDPEESADDSEDFLEPEDLDDPDASSASLNKLSPATPKVSSNSTNWPFNALTTHHNSSNSSGYPGTFPDGHAQNYGGGGNRRRASFEDPNHDTMNSDDELLEAEPIPASSLPHEILLHILRLLPPTALAPALRVCKAWCQCGVELLWHKPMFTSLPALYKMLQVLSHSSTQTFPYPEFVRRINFSNLTEEMSDKMLGKLLPCTRIERLTLTGCKNLSSQSMVDLLKQSKRLVALDLSEVENVDDEVIGALAENCPRLQGLNLTGCGKVGDKGLEKLAKGCPALRRIKLRKCDLITDVSIVLLSINCPLLLEIDLGLCLSITSTSLQQLFRTSHNIRELCLNGCTSLTDDGFPDSPSLSLLTSTHSSSYSSAQASPLPSDSSSSSSGDPSRPSSPGPSPLSAPSGALIRRPPPLTSPPSLHSFDHLRYLDLTSLILLTDQAIAGIIKFMPKIRNLILAKCGRLTDESLYEICKVGKHLHYLHLGHVNSITDKAVTAIARSCTRLRYIDLACCNNLTDVSVLELAANLPRLKRIGLVRVTNITDASLDALHARTSLERIHLSYCSNLTVSGVNDLLQHLPRLTHLSLTEVQAFRKKVLQVFCRPPPKDFNDHQRRSFCVFSGRGVHDLRRYLRSLSPAELEVLSQPDPPSDDDLTRVGNRGLGQQGGGGGIGANQQQIQQRMQGVNNATGGGGNGNGGGGGTAAQVAQARIRLAQIAQARQTMGQNGNGNGRPTIVPGGGGGILGSPFAMGGPQTQPQPPQTQQQSPLQQSYRTPRAYQAWLDQQSQLQQQGGGGGASSIASTSTSNLPHTTSFAPLPSTSRNGAGSSGSQQQQQQQAGFNRPSLYRQNSLGLSGASQVGEETDYDFSADLNDTETMHNIPIRSVPSTGSSNSMELDSPIDQTASTSGSTRPPRLRRATVTRTNYRSSGPSHRRGGGSEMEDDDDDGEDEGEATGEEEDLTMGDA